MPTAIVWFRRDLRLDDNPALSAAVGAFDRVVPVYIDAPDEAGAWPAGAASRWWLHHSLAALDADLRARGSALLLRRGDSRAALLELTATLGAEAVFWNRRYEPAALAAERRVEATLRERGLRAEGFNAALLFEPWQIAKKSGGPYRVFTPFWNAAQALGMARPGPPLPSRLPPAPAAAGVPLAALELLPRIPWHQGLAETWQPGERGAHARLQRFLEHGLGRYRERRDIPAAPGTSALSPHLHFGEIGPRRVVAEINTRAAAHGAAGRFAAAEAFLRQLGWREFGHHLLFHFPHTPEQPLDERFARFPWATDPAEALHAWRHGRTGIPIVDAGLRELWHSGWMHNRVRMLAASLLTKNLLVPWQTGARWFWDTLVDADLANNTLGWQWVAGCGADAAPYFRIFNPASQGQRFDPQGGYVRRWVPELARLPDRHLHHPWRAPEAELRRAGVLLGRDYPRPVVDLKASREEALARFRGLSAR